jgi:hypothetical protein
MTLYNTKGGLQRLQLCLLLLLNICCGTKNPLGTEATVAGIISTSITSSTMTTMTTTVANKTCDCPKPIECPTPSVCLTEDCIMAASTVLSSLDRSVDPCEDFYEFACGGWIKKSIVSSTDRFMLVDQTNQKAIHKMLDAPQVTGEEFSADTKAKRFYASCLNTSQEQEKVNLADLMDIIDEIGGWHLTQTFHPEVTFDQRVQKLQSKLGVNVFFTWGVIEQEGQNRLALVAGGWNDALVVEEGDKEAYLKIMSRYTRSLVQAKEESISPDIANMIIEPVPGDVNYSTEASTIDIIYEYEDISENEIEIETETSSSTYGDLLGLLTGEPSNNAALHEPAQELRINLTKSSDINDNHVSEGLNDMIIEPVLGAVNYSTETGTINIIYEYEDISENEIETEPNGDSFSTDDTYDTSYDTDDNHVSEGSGMR